MRGGGEKVDGRSEVELKKRGISILKMGLGWGRG